MGRNLPGSQARARHCKASLTSQACYLSSKVTLYSEAVTKKQDLDQAEDTSNSYADQVQGSKKAEEGMRPLCRTAILFETVLTGKELLVTGGPIWMASLQP